jgi:hypothetical protein
VNDWLKEAEYTRKNVVVFDFYNILTDANAHHRYADGKIEHIVGKRDTLAYPSGDDHPSEKGSQKATEEFIPFLNSYYHQWIVDAPAAVVAEAGNTSALPQPTKEIPRTESPAPGGALIDDVEGSVPSGTNGWEVFRDESVPTRLRCEADATAAHAGPGPRNRFRHPAQFLGNLQSPLWQSSGLERNRWVDFLFIGCASRFGF